MNPPIRIRLPSTARIRYAAPAPVQVRALPVGMPGTPGAPGEGVAAHAARQDNPHNVTAAQIGAATEAGLTAETAARVAALLLKADKSDTYTKAQVDAAIAALVNGAPGALDTLAELAAALGDNDDAIAALTNTIAGKQAASATLDALAALTTTDYGRALLTLADAAALRSLLGVTRYVESSPVAVPGSTDSAASFAHGLGVVPKKFGVLLQCKSAVAGYAVGDRVWHHGFRTTSFLATASADATLITIAWDSVPSQLYFLAPKAGGTAVAISAADWDFIFWAEG